MEHTYFFFIEIYWYFSEKVEYNFKLNEIGKKENWNGLEKNKYVKMKVWLLRQVQNGNSGNELVHYVKEQVF